MFLNKYKWLLATGMLSVAIALMFFNQEIKPASGVATINVNAIMMKYVKNQAKSSLDSTALQENTKVFVKQLENEIQLLSKNKNITVFVSEAILAGGQDYTVELEKSVYKSLNISRPA